MFAPIISKTTITQNMRSASITAVLAVALLAGQSVTAVAQAPAAQAPTSQINPAAAMGATAKHESVEDRITSLHSSLKITSKQEADWKAVADVMRGNVAAMEKLAAEKIAKDPATMTAIDDLKNYESFAQAHVTGLKKLISAFGTLYEDMAPDQKKIADQVFDAARHEHAASHG